MKRKDWIILEKLVPIILDNIEGCVVDIGIGSSTELLSDYSFQFGRKHFSCDINQKFCNWAEKTLSHLEIFCGSSDDFINQFSDIPVAVVFIDGDHHYPVVLKEVNFFLSKLVFGGVIFMHDTFPSKWQDIYGFVNKKPGKNYGKYYDVTCDSYLVRQQLEQRKDLMVFTWPYTASNFGLTMIMKKNMEGPEFRR